ncbi:tRNA preQ1(34) S-adenosylmethionine ribosyltransferase-isomerase QueA [Candidatus Woesearchaeota archaeon]|nr:tRNA preQ1(34) S-adenosylmethionine ribosyltransferase-isomerase QueA [Candidatus Woesearchaeota archaeon]
MKLADFNYELPKERIAQKPVSPRDNSRLMIVSDSVEHKFFFEIIDYLSKGDVLVVNETKVVPAKLVGKKDTGTKVELIVEEVDGNRCKCWIKSKNPKTGNRLIFGKFIGKIVKQDKAEVEVVFNADVNLIMKKIGELPTPPYVKRKLDRDSQYQTVYSKKKGSIAAPTAGLHFTKELLGKIKKKGVKIAKICLHVDFGTFLPVRDLKKHKMHSEYFEIDKKNADLINNRKRKLIVVGTTSMRALESVAEKGKVRAKRGNTKLFIKPGYRFKMKYDAMITNFHLPKSTLLMLVSAFVGRKKILDAYKIAVKEKYMFFSFGDAMLLKKFK